MNGEHDISDLLRVVATDGVVEWSSMYVSYEDGGQRGHDEPDIYIVSPEGVAIEVWYLRGDYVNHLAAEDDVSTHRQFQIAGDMFVTSADGSNIWADPDLDAWVIESRDFDPDDGGPAVMLVERKEVPSAERYTQLVEKSDVSDAVFVLHPVWSTEYINRILSHTARAFYGLDITFRYVAETNAVPESYQELMDMVDHVEIGEALVWRACQYQIIDEGALWGEVGQNCSKRAEWKNPDGTRACAYHKETGAVPLGNEVDAF